MATTHPRVIENPRFSRSRVPTGFERRALRAFPSFRRSARSLEPVACVYCQLFPGSDCRKPRAIALRRESSDDSAQRKRRFGLSRKTNIRAQSSWQKDSEFEEDNKRSQNFRRRDEI